MGKTTVITSSNQEDSPNLELGNSAIIQPKKRKKVVIRTKSNSKQERTIANFYRLIVVTGIVFGFGGLGFGMTLRYGQGWQTLNSFHQNHQQEWLNHKP